MNRWPPPVPEPGATPDWDAIDAACPWLAPLADCPQDPIWHAEGDVLTHTRAVTEALVADPAWRDATPDERSTLFAAALLHDIAKPPCTRTEPDGRITTRGHARRGANVARRLLWSAEHAPDFVLRETVAALVRWHGLPLFMLDREDPHRQVRAASLEVDTRALQTLSRADVRGRICQDADDLHDRLALFTELCREAGCWARPAAFSDGISRFAYFNGAPGRPPRAVHDDTRSEVDVLCGLPAAGKDTWIARERPDWPVVSLDDIRRELRIDPAGDQAPVAAKAQARATVHLREGRSFVWNATNLRRPVRERLIRRLTDYRARVRLIYVEPADLPTLRRRNAARDQPVPGSVIERMLDQLELPSQTEAHEVQYVIDGTPRTLPA